MKKYAILFVALVAVLCTVLPASAALVTDGLVGYYTVDGLSGTSVATWSNSAIGTGAWGSAAYSAGSAGILAAQTPVAGKAAVDLTAGAGAFSLTLGGWTNHDVYDSYSGMTILMVMKVSEVTFYGGIAGPFEDNGLRQGGMADNTQMLINDNGNYYVAGNSNPVVNKWTILGSDMTNNTSGSATVEHLYQTDYTIGTPTTSSWTATAASGDGTFKIYGSAGYDQFSFGGGLYWWGGVNTKSKSEIAAVLVYNKVLTTEERAATTDALYTNFFTTGGDVPEPGSMLALACGLASFAGIAIRRRR